MILICSRCKSVKTELDFYKNPNTLTGYNTICKVCQKKYSLARAKSIVRTEEEQQAYLAYQKEYRENKKKENILSK